MTQTSQQHRRRRSALYVPASHSRAVEKAASLGADCIILDLEDAVAPQAKQQARARACDAVRLRAFGQAEVIIRINGLDMAWGREDLPDVVAAQPDAILVPKVGSPSDVLRISAAMDDLGAGPAMKLWAMIETPGALLQVHPIAAQAQSPSSRLQVLVLGLNDLSRETFVRFVPGRGPMHSWLSSVVLAARASGLYALDGVYNALEDPQGLRAECEQAVSFGFDGKTLIHPNQVDIANQVFTPDDAEVAHAREIIAAFNDPAHAGLGAIRVRAVMVERLHLQGAYRTLALARAGVS